MRTLHAALSWVWQKLNPVEPSIRYLMGFMGFAILVFLVGILLGTIYATP